MIKGLVETPILQLVLSFHFILCFHPVMFFLPMSTVDVICDNMTVMDRMRTASIRSKLPMLCGIIWKGLGGVALLKELGH